jgi:hypothetical protein
MLNENRWTAHSKAIVLIQATMLFRLVDCKCLTLIDLGMLLQDMANRLLDLAQEIREEVVAESQVAERSYY